MTVTDETRSVRQGSFGWMISRLSRSMDERMSDALQPLGLAMPQFPVMMMVLEHGALTQAEIGKRYQRPAYTISRALDGLEESGLIERRPHPTSRRAHEIHATAMGEALAPELHAIVRMVNQEILAPLSDAERTEMMSLLSRVLPG